MTIIEKMFQRLLEWMLCCPVSDEEQFNANLRELYTVIIPVSLSGAMLGLLLCFVFDYLF